MRVRSWWAHCTMQRSEPTSDKRSAKVNELHFTPLELIDRIAVMALVAPAQTATVQCATTTTGAVHLGLCRKATLSQPRPSLDSRCRCRPSVQRTICGRC